MPIVSLSALSDALEFASVDGGLGETEAFVDRETGKVIIVDDEALCGMSEEEQGVPEDVRESPRYLRVPGKRDLDLGVPLIMAFVREKLPHDFDEVSEIFRHKGAYRKFRIFLERRAGALDAWHAYQNAAETNALRDWCASHGLEPVTP